MANKDTISVQDDGWVENLYSRERNELGLCRLYAADFAHGTAGHNRMMLIARLADILDRYELTLRKAYEAIDK